MELSHWNQKNVAETTGATEMERIERIERGDCIYVSVCAD